MIFSHVHRFSGICLSLFVGLHLSNHLCSVAGIALHIEVMQLFRHFYRHPFVETLLLLAVVLQIVSGIGQLRRLRGKPRFSFVKLQVWSGLYLAFFLTVHVAAVFVGRLFLQLDTNFYFAAAGINRFPAGLFFVPYYALAVLAFFGHLAALHALRMQHNLLHLTPARQAQGLLLVGLVVMLLIFYGFTNRFRGVRVPPAYEVLTGKPPK